MNQKLKIVLILFILINLNACNLPYLNIKERKAASYAFDILKGFLPDDELSVSYSIWYDMSGPGPLDIVNENYSNELDSLYLKKRLSNEFNRKPRYSAELYNIFKNKEIKEGENKRCIVFFEPYNNTFMCEIRPLYEGKPVVANDSIIQQFLFKYDEDGEILQISKTNIRIDE